MTYDVQHIALSDIYLDHAFNCRSEVTLASVADLAENIAEHGLQYPIIVQPCPHTDFTGREIHDVHPYYRVVVGHRRYRAFEALRRETIPAMVREGLSERQALILNLDENLKRKQINILEEAHAIKRLYETGLTIREMAREIHQSKGWVQARVNLLRLPEDVQNDAAAGLLSQYDVAQIAGEKGVKAQLRRTKQLKDGKIRQKLRVQKKKSRRPTVEEMKTMIVKLSPETREYETLAWCLGLISTEEFEAI